MNNPFKVGQRVLVRDEECDGYVLRRGEVYTITKIYNEFIYLDHDNRGWYASRFYLASGETDITEDRAINFLKNKGWALTPPEKPKFISGTIYVVIDKNNDQESIDYLSEEAYIAHSPYWEDNFKVLTTVDWSANVESTNT